MQRILYTQTWPLEYWISEVDSRNTSEEIWRDEEEVRFLTDLGYEPVKRLGYNYARQNVELELIFRIPDEIMTWFLLHYPSKTTIKELF
jgi:hypothetical protein